MGISNLTGKRLKCVKQSAVSDHLLECNCSIDFDYFDILGSDENRFRLLIKEILLIKRDQPQLNKIIKSSEAYLSCQRRLLNQEMSIKYRSIIIK